MIDSVKERLENFGYEVRQADEFALTFCIEKIQNTIKNETNCREVPEGLKNIAVDMATGEFLSQKKMFSPEDITNLDLDYAVKQIQTGDTNTVFAVGEGSLTSEQRFDNFVNYLLTYGRSEFSSYRRIKW